MQTTLTTENSTAVLYCTKGGEHSGERIQMICTHPLCRTDALCCVICKSRTHKHHETVLLKTFLEEMSWKTRHSQRKTGDVIQKEVEQAERMCLEAVVGIKRYTMQKLVRLEEKMKIAE